MEEGMEGWRDARALPLGKLNPGPNPLCGEPSMVSDLLGVQAECPLQRGGGSLDGGT